MRPVVLVAGLGRVRARASVYATVGDRQARQCASSRSASSVGRRRSSQEEPYQYADNELRHEHRSTAPRR
jgi:hypothetical protein